MQRRLYFVFPDAQQTSHAVADLQRAGVTRNHMHTVARDGTDIASLPMATSNQKNDMAWRIEGYAWRADLVIFSAALCGFLVALYSGFVSWALIALAVMIVSFVTGMLFVTRVPDTHLDEFHGALAHGEVLLMVDVPRARMEEIETLMARRHPAAVAGGSSWTIDGLGI